MRILVHLEGGIVQSVSADCPLDADVVVIDYDTSCTDLDELHQVPQSENPSDTSYAYVSRHGKIQETFSHITEFLNNLPQSE